MKKVTIYTTPTCGYCKLTKEFFKEHGVSYEERDVASDEKAREEMMNKTNLMSVPVIDIGGEIIAGFNEEKLTELLHIK